jgi:hypothetical protein
LFIQNKNLITIELQPVSKGAENRLNPQDNINKPVNHGVHLKPVVETIAKLREIAGPVFIA